MSSGKNRRIKDGIEYPFSNRNPKRSRSKHLSKLPQLPQQPTVVYVPEHHLEIYLERDPISPSVLSIPSTWEMENPESIATLVNLVAKLNGWHKEHFVSIKDDDPYKELLMFSNPDGIYYVDKDGYYVPTNKIKEAVDNYNKGLMPAMDVNNLYETLRPSVTFARNLKRGGKLKKYLEGGVTVIQSPEDILGNLLSKPWEDLTEIDYNTLGVQWISGQDALKLVNPEVTYRSNGVPVLEIIKNNPNKKFPVLNGQLFSKNLWELMRTNAAFAANSGAISDHYADFEVLQEKNRREGERRGKLIDALGLGLMFAAPAAVGAVAAAPYVAPIIKWLTPFMTAEEAYQTVKSIKEGNYGEALLHGLATASGGYGTYGVFGGTTPKIFTTLSELLYGGATAAANTIEENKLLENIETITPEELNRIKPSLEAIHNELRRLNYVVEQVGVGDASQWVVKGRGQKAQQGEEDLSFNDFIDNLLIHGSGAAVYVGPNVGKKWARAIAYVRDKWPNVVEHVRRHKELYKFGFSLAPGIIYDIYELCKAYANSDSSNLLDVGERAKVLIDYILNMVTSDLGDPNFQYHYVSPYSFSDKQRTGQVYEGQSHGVADSISRLETVSLTGLSTSRDSVMSGIPEGNIADGDVSDTIK